MPPSRRVEYSYCTVYHELVDNHFANMRSALAPLLPLLPLFAALSVDELVLSGRCDFREISRPGPYVHEPAIVRAHAATQPRRDRMQR